MFTYNNSLLPSLGYWDTSSEKPILIYLIFLKVLLNIFLNDCGSLNN